ncbi:MAG: ChrB protein [Chloroflexi bacterium]|nr:ChrB protein [Chloroflexota bacterium]
MTTWLLFTYKVPNKPSARRVYVWRKLKGLGAILLHDTAWVLPDTPYTREKLQWLTTEVRDMDEGEATLWEAQQVFTGQDMDLKQQFINQVDTSYRDLLSELEKPDADLSALAKQYQQTKRFDYFRSELGEQVRQTLVEQRGLDEG